MRFVRLFIPFVHSFIHSLALRSRSLAQTRPQIHMCSCPHIWTRDGITIDGYLLIIASDCTFGVSNGRVPRKIKSLISSNDLKQVSLPLSRADDLVNSREARRKRELLFRPAGFFPPLPRVFRGDPPISRGSAVAFEDTGSRPMGKSSWDRQRNDRALRPDASYRDVARSHSSPVRSSSLCAHVLAHKSQKNPAAS